MATDSEKREGRFVLTDCVILKSFIEIFAFGLSLEI